METRWRALADDRRVVDAVLILGCLFLAVLAVKTPWSPVPRPVNAVAGVVGCGAQWWRRRNPAVAAVAGSAAFVLSGNPGPLLLGLYSGGAYAARRFVPPLAVVGWAGLVGWSWIDAGALRLGDVVTWALAAVVIAAAGVYSATRRELRDSLRERAERAEAEQSRHAEQARFAERGRIAREMHDVLAHKVSLIAVHAGALELSAGDDPERTRQGAALIRVTAREALHELRTVLGVLQSEPAPFADLAALVDESVQAGQPVELADRAGPLPPDTARIVYRVAQEGLTNARKHAPGAPVTIAIDPAEGGSVTVAVRNGPPPGAALGLPGAGAGLIGLAERLRLAGGTLHSGREDDGGWLLRAAVPVAGAGAS